MQPLSTVTVTRAWHWGIAILSDPSLGGEIPDVDPDAPVSSNRNGIVVLVRHAQDQMENFDTDDWAEASVTVRYLPESPSPHSDDEVVLWEGDIDTPTGRLWIGDADGDVSLSGPPEVSRVRVLAAAEDQQSPGRVWIDVWSPSEAPASPQAEQTPAQRSKSAKSRLKGRWGK